MKEFAGLAAVIAIIMGAVVATRAPDAATPRMQAVELMESQSVDAPAYVQIDPDDWR